MSRSPTVSEPSLVAGEPGVTPATNTPHSSPIPLAGGGREDNVTSSAHTHFIILLLITIVIINLVLDTDHTMTEVSYFAFHPKMDDKCLGRVICTKKRGFRKGSLERVMVLCGTIITPITL